MLMASAPVRSSKADLSSRSPSSMRSGQPRAPGARSAKPAASLWSSRRSAPPTTASMNFRWRSDRRRSLKG